jgi:hypothetical protein
VKVQQFVCQHLRQRAQPFLLGTYTAQLLRTRDPPPTRILPGGCSTCPEPAIAREKRAISVFDLPRKFPVIPLEFPVLQRNFPDSLLREFAKKSLRHSAFLL